MSRILTTLLLLALFIAAESQVYHSCPAYLPSGGGYENPLFEQWLSAYDVKHYHLTLEVSNTDTHIGGSAELVVEATRELDTLVLELQDSLDVTDIMFTDEIGSMTYPAENELEFEHHGDAIYIELDRTRHQGELFRVKINYEGDAGRDRGFFAGINSKQDSDYGFDVTYTLSEPHNARDWFPVKQVLQDKIDSVTFSLICDKELLAGSNGLLVEVEEAGSDHILTWKTHYPMVYYLLSFAVADYMDYSFYAPLSDEGDSVLVQNYIYDTDDVLTDWKEGIDETGPLITLFSQLLTDYPFADEKYGHCMAPMGGGMEHQTMTTIQDFRFFLVAHELAHQWFGDHITCGNWQDIWINEGFASYMEYVAAEHLRGQEAADEWMEDAISIALGEKEGSVYVPEEEVENESRLFSYGLSYKKGAILLHMIRFMLDDDDLFFGVLRTYLYRYQNGLATGADFQAILEEVSEMDFSCFFEQWYYGEGYPIFQIFWEQAGDSLVIRSEQSGTASDITPLFQVPFELDIMLSSGHRQRVRLMQQSNQDEFHMTVEGFVERVVFDPDNHLLKTATVIQKTPTDKPFRYGPNPVTSELMIQFPNISLIDAVRITNLSGQEVYKATGAENPLTLNLSSLADGPYLLELTSASETYQERIVKISAN
ncbi:MAG: T9SS type A sorting domain-containing protein [Bacteroidales bacterium]|nr:T9SS type A sorting domain-containing protein [Bacteroidales bacterium]